MTKIAQIAAVYQIPIVNFSSNMAMQIMCMLQYMYMQLSYKVIEIKLWYRILHLFGCRVCVCWTQVELSWSRCAHQ